MTTPTNRDREVSELARNSGSRAERDAIIAAYREECVKATIRSVIDYLVARSIASNNGAVLTELDLIRDELRTQLREP